LFDCFNFKKETGIHIFCLLIKFCIDNPELSGRLMKKILFIFGIFAVIIVSCTKSKGRGDNGAQVDDLIDCNGVSATFSADVNIIIQTSCAAGSGCHDEGSTNGPGPLLTYSQIYNARIAIRSAVVSGAMPLGSTLSTIQKNTVACWVKHGAPAN